MGPPIGDLQLAGSFTELLEGVESLGLRPPSRGVFSSEGEILPLQDEEIPPPTAKAQTKKHKAPGI